ncbi:MAG: LysM peptidoglycan-binding domain-containing protein [Clostridiales bacterium]|jgi:GH25 family lysozyme M1 (1,4-beta-N-acetylmuramidase)|nr:LysM peptidoglycan-binding domain-containing protein [Clostridiales bacterium]
MFAVNGIDVSHHQGDIDFARVKAAGVKFAMIRAGYGWENQSEQTDRKFYRNYKMATDVGLPCGSYHYSYATTPQEAEKEADFFLNIVKGCKFGYPVAFDMEDKTQANLGRSRLSDIAVAFCDKVEKAGYYVCVYSNLDWIRNRLDMQRLKRFDLWFARYNDKPGYEGMGMWQYSSSGKVDGIAANVDMDVAYKDYPSIMKAHGLNGYPKAAPAKKRYTVKPGDNMSKIALKHGVTLKALIAANPQIKNPNLIWAGTVLLIP